MRILIAEDDFTARDLLKITLQIGGYEVVETTDGAAAWEALQQPSAPQLAILDWMMPGMEGIEVVRRVRALPTALHPYIIMLSAKSDKHNIITALEAGANDYLVKPFHMGELKARIAVGRHAVEMQTGLADANESLSQYQEELMFQNHELSETQMALKTSQTRYFDLYDTAPVGYVTLTEKDTILEANSTATNLLVAAGCSLVKQQFASFIFREDLDIYFWFNKNLLANEKPPPCELRMNKHDGAQAWVRIEATAARNGPGAMEKRLVLSDVSIHKQSEEEKSRIKGQLQQLQKMESVGRLAGGVAHDFNNMLGVILGHAELAMEQAGPDSPVYADLQEILTAADRSANLTRQLLAFSRQQTISPKEINLSDAISGMLKMLNRLIGEDVQLNFVPGKDLWSVRMDPSQVDQVLANLCVNARDAIADVGTITIETDNCTLDEGFCATHAEAVPGDYVRLTVSDTGCGMDKETISHIFEPFFTTKEVGKGTGLGLATVYGIVTQNGGFIDASSEPGTGTRITVYLARHLSTAEMDRAENKAGPHARGHETILLVEDEPAILKMTKSLLERQGYTVLAASSPGDALNLAPEQAIHLLMTDVVMPKMNGRELAGILKARYPHLRVLFMSGYTASVISHHGVLDPGVFFIQKPFSLRDLASTVRRVLDQAQG
ncbi:MAG: response regulator [Verrucomicrobiota bacterium]